MKDSSLPIPPALGVLTPALAPPIYLTSSVVNPIPLFYCSCSGGDGVGFISHLIEESWFSWVESHTLSFAHLSRAQIGYGHRGKLLTLGSTSTLH